MPYTLFKPLRGLIMLTAVLFLTGCIATSMIQPDIKDDYFDEKIHAVKHARKVGEDILVCISASNSRATDPIDYTLKVPYQALTSWYQSKEQEYLAKDKTTHWQNVKPIWYISEEAVDFQSCGSETEPDNVRIIDIAYFYNFRELLWYPLDELQVVDHNFKNIAHRVQYADQVNMLQDIYKTLPAHQDIVLRLVEYNEYEGRIYHSYTIFYYVDASLKYPYESYFAFKPPKRFVKGNKKLKLLLPVTYLIDTITLPLQILLLMNFHH